MRERKKGKKGEKLRIRFNRKKAKYKEEVGAKKYMNHEARVISFTKQRKIPI